MRTVRDLLEHVRQDHLYDDPDGSLTSVWEDDTDCLWSNNNLVRYLNLAIREFAIRSPIRDATTEELCSLAVPAGSHPVVSIDRRVLTVESAKLASQDEALVKRYLNNQLEDLYPNWRAFAGVPTVYLEDMDDYKIRLVGTLAADDVLQLVVTRLPLEDVPWAYSVWSEGAVAEAGGYTKPTTYNGHFYQATVGGTTGSTEPGTWPTDGTSIVDNDVEWTDAGLIGDVEIPDFSVQNLTHLADWMCHLAYKKNDTGTEGETYNPVLADEYERRFERYVGPRPTAQRLRNSRRTANLRRRSRTYY